MDNQRVCDSLCVSRFAFQAAAENPNQTQRVKTLLDILGTISNVSFWSLTYGHTMKVAS